MNYVLVNNKPSILMLTAFPGFPSLRLNPTAVIEIPEEHYNLLKDDPTFASFVRRGWITVKKARQEELDPVVSVDEQQPPEADDPGQMVDGFNTLEGMSTSDAKSMVNNTDSVEMLNRFLSTEKRHGIVKAIQRRIDELTSLDREEMFPARVDAED